MRIWKTPRHFAGMLPKRRLLASGFLLPVVIILSVAISTVATLALKTVADSSVSLVGQDLQRQAKTAANAGITAAQNCVKQNNGAAGWQAAKPLTPQLDCTGTTGSNTYIFEKADTWQSTFSVGEPVIGSNVITVTSTGTVKTVYNGVTIGSTVTQTVKAIIGTTIPRPVGTVSSITTGSTHTCVITLSGLPYCWGNSLTGQVGNNDASIFGQGANPSPRAVSQTAFTSGKTYTSLEGGDGHTCGIAGGGAVCWGSNYMSQLGNGTTFWPNDNGIPVMTITAVPNQVTATPFGANPLSKLTAGFSHTCALAGTKPYCWGRASQGESGGPPNLNPCGIVNIPFIGPVCQTAVPYNAPGGSPYASPPIAVAGPAASKNIVSLSAGGYHSCAAASDGTAYCWGVGSRGQLGRASTASSGMTSVAVNLSNAEVVGKPIVSISTGTNHTCAIAGAARELFCWGANDYGQLGFGVRDAVNYTIPYSVSARSPLLVGKQITQVVAGDQSTCALANNEVYCWGKNESGQLGIGTTSNTYADANAPKPEEQTGAVSPTKVVSTLLSGKTITQIAVSKNISGVAGTGAYAGDHACAVADYFAYCWGANGGGQLGNGTATASNVPVAVKSDDLNVSGRKATDISAGSAHACAVTGGKVVCWGQNTFSQLGNGEGQLSFIASPVGIDTTNMGQKVVTKVTTSHGNYFVSGDQAHSCALADGDGYCWGSALFGQLGMGPPPYPALAVPQPVVPSGALSGKKLTDISGGYAHTCAVGNDSRAYCWGLNIQCQLGIASGMSNGFCTNLNTYEPVAVSTTSPLGTQAVTRISAGFQHSCAIVTGTKVYCWGNAANGRVGDPTLTTTPLPKQVVFAPPVAAITDISAGTATTCAVADGRAYCWGSNANGELGQGSSITESALPLPVLGPLVGQVVTQISVGAAHVCALVATGDVYCWGSNAQGQFGNSSSISSSTPVLLPKAGTAIEGKAISKVTAGDIATCVIVESKPYCFGSNSSGQLGDTTAVPHYQPKLVYSFENVTTAGIGGGGSVIANSPNGLIRF